jgi:hypothetical protein
MDQINKTSVAGLHPPLNETQLIHRLIAQYLAHDGYIDTARSFAAEVRQENHNLVRGISDAAADSKDLEPEEDLDAIQRQSKWLRSSPSLEGHANAKILEIRAAILEGDIDRAHKFMNVYYPNVLHENENIYFKLRCRKYIEMIRQWADLKDGTSPTLGHSSSKSINIGDDYNGVFDHQMELDDQFNNSVSHNGNGHGSKWDDGSHMDTSDDGAGALLDGHSMSAAGGRSEVDAIELMNKTIAYGQELTAEFGGDLRREVKKTLNETLALIAYEHPKESPLSSLLDEAGRGPVAEELNGAILGKSVASPLRKRKVKAEICE